MLHFNLSNHSQVDCGLHDHFAITIGDLWDIYGLSVAFRFLVFSFRFCRRDTEPLPRGRLNTSIDTSKKNNDIKTHPERGEK